MMYEVSSYIMGPYCTTYYVEYYQQDTMVTSASGTDLYTARRAALQKIY
jgi:hypothetical protein